MSPEQLVPVVSTWQPRIRAFYARRCRERDDVDDLVQEAIAAIIRCYPTFSQRSTLSTWIYAVCRNVLSNHIYYHDRDCRLIRRLSVELPATDSELPVALREVIGELPADARRLYALYYVEGRGVREIAARLHRPEGTVKYLLHVLRRDVRRLLDA